MWGRKRFDILVAYVTDCVLLIQAISTATFMIFAIRHVDFQPQRRETLLWTGTPPPLPSSLLSHPHPHPLCLHCFQSVSSK